MTVQTACNKTGVVPGAGGRKEFLELE